MTISASKSGRTCKTVKLSKPLLPRYLSLVRHSQHPKTWLWFAIPRVCMYGFQVCAGRGMGLLIKAMARTATLKAHAYSGNFSKPDDRRWIIDMATFLNRTTAVSTFQTQRSQFQRLVWCISTSVSEDNRGRAYPSFVESACLYHPTLNSRWANCGYISELRVDS
jgi:hypothetical protein